MSRLVLEVREDWSRDSEDREADLDYLMEFLEREIRRKERCKSYGGLEVSQNIASKNNVRSKVQGSVSALHSSCSSINKIQCGFCKRNHASEKCYRYLQCDVKDRLSMVDKARLCFRCLGRNHVARVCDEKCDICKGQHHVTTCYKQTGEKKVEV